MSETIFNPFSCSNPLENIHYLLIDLSWIEGYRDWFFPFAHFITPKDFVYAFASLPAGKDIYQLYTNLFFEEDEPKYFRENRIDFDHYIEKLQEALIKEYYSRLNHLIEDLQLSPEKDYILEKFVTNNTGLIRID